MTLSLIMVIILEKKWVQNLSLSLTAHFNITWNSKFSQIPSTLLLVHELNLAKICRSFCVTIQLIIISLSFHMLKYIEAQWEGSDVLTSCA